MLTLTTANPRAAAIIDAGWSGASHANFASAQTSSMVNDAGSDFDTSSQRSLIRLVGGLDGLYPEYSTTVGYGPLSAGPGRVTRADRVVPSLVSMYCDPAESC